MEEGRPVTRVSTTTIALAVFLTSSATVAGGGWLVHRALGLPAPDRTRPPEVPGVVTEVAALRCGTRSRPKQCYRPIVSYHHGGEPRQVQSRTLYRSAPRHDKGERVAVLIEADGTAWLESEWRDDLAVRERDYRSARDFPLLMGALLLFCGGLGILLAIVVGFFTEKPAPA